MPITLDRALIIDQKDNFILVQLWKTVCLFGLPKERAWSGVPYQEQGDLQKVASLRSPITGGELKEAA